MTDENSILSAAQRIAADRIGAGQPSRQRSAGISSGNFEAAFKQALGENGNNISFSSHAISRLQKRNLSLDAAQLDRLDNAVAKAEEKGAKESLVMLDDTALIVSITNKKVITAMHIDGMKENVVTNIDSAVIS